MSDPSPEFLYLTATLLSSLPLSDKSVDETLLLQLHSIFGPMLLSALQIMDRQDGSPYTIFLDLPHSDPEEEITTDPTTTAGTDHPVNLLKPLLDSRMEDSPDIPVSDTSGNIHGNNQSRAAEEMNRDASEINPTIDAVRENDGSRIDSEKRSSAKVSSERMTKEARLKRSRNERIQKLVDTLKTSYCPCAGYGCHSFGSGKNVLREQEKEGRERREKVQRKYSQEMRCRVSTIWNMH
ncbi:hypothetical protein TREMEDRAFT_66212 [Tremella mesenterica DSM 1558]|uniref:uncharacterized protein n=1 Tax=Tremella mesenterica (strain ATCC 24925 / CBS 8224 / DSM 1558 / NBRC 9311 / NRRL Y-6157 / RJB 2259-6 / UBC 559-6) TaxID=578456 RepID=UPI00032C0E52|nr:uncharacterized protein TREMEDRAFT_66212 [Tremella mesenterica DSM 1558]EIW65844.1 hypothetical protein TREMEDRAFT_66212 [Tremella mesenterica DSM 1558]